VLAGVGEANEGAEPAAQPLGVVARLDDRLLHLRAQQPQLVADDPAVERLLGREVLVEDRLGDPGRVGDRLHGRAPVAVPREQVAGDLEELGTAGGSGEAYPGLRHGGWSSLAFLRLAGHPTDRYVTDQ